MQTPLEPTQGYEIDDRVVAVPILRAGLGLVGPVLELLPHVTVGYIGLERDERTAIASRYYVKLPPDIKGKAVMILDPMLATGGTATKAVEIMKEYHPASVRLVCVVAAPEGIDALLTAHPDVQIFAAARDRQLNDQKYILPGLGHASVGQQFFDPGDVRRRPVAGWLARREAACIGLLVDGLYLAVDPAVGQRLFDRLVVGDALFA